MGKLCKNCTFCLPFNEYYRDYFCSHPKLNYLEYGEVKYSSCNEARKSEPLLTDSLHSFYGQSEMCGPLGKFFNKKL